MENLSKKDILKVLSNTVQLNNYIKYSGSNYNQGCKTSLEEYLQGNKNTSNIKITPEDYPNILNKFNDLYNDFQETIEDRINAIVEDSISTINLDKFQSIKTKEQYNQVLQFVEKSMKKSLSSNLFGTDEEDVQFPNFLPMRERLALLVKSVKLANSVIEDTVRIQTESRNLNGNITTGLQYDNDQSRTLGTGMATVYDRVPQGRGRCDGHTRDLGESSSQSGQGSRTEGRGDGETLRDEQSTTNDIEHNGADAVAQSETTIRRKNGERTDNIHQQMVGRLVETLPTLTNKYQNTLKQLNSLKNQLNGNSETLPKINVITANKVFLCDFDKLYNSDKNGIKMNETSQQKVVFNCASQFSVNIDGLEVQYSFIHQLGTGKQGILDKLNEIANNPQHELHDITKNQVLPYLKTCVKIKELSKECQSLMDKIQSLQEDLSNQVIEQDEIITREHQSIEYICNQITQSNEKKSDIYYILSLENDNKEDALKQYYMDNGTDIDSEILDEGILINSITYSWNDIINEIYRQIKENVYLSEIEQEPIIKPQATDEPIQKTDNIIEEPSLELCFKVNDIIPLLDSSPSAPYKPFVIESISQNEVTLRDLEFAYPVYEKRSIEEIQCAYDDVIKNNSNFDFSLKKCEDTHNLRISNKFDYDGEEYLIRRIDENANFCWCQSEKGNDIFLNINQAVELKNKTIDKWKDITRKGNNVIGNAVFKYIPQKQFIKLDTDTALKIAKELEKKIKYSGKVNPKDNTITLTISKNDWNTFNDIKKSIKDISKPKTPQTKVKLKDVFYEMVSTYDTEFTVDDLLKLPLEKQQKIADMYKQSEPFDIDNHYELDYNILVQINVAINESRLNETPIISDLLNNGYKVLSTYIKNAEDIIYDEFDESNHNITNFDIVRATYSIRLINPNGETMSFDGYYKIEQAINDPTNTFFTQKKEVHGLYDKLSKIFPKFMENNCIYSKYSTENYEPLALEKINSNQISVAHYYEQNGDLMRDPEIVFNVDYDNKTLTPMEYYNDGLGNADLVETEQSTNKTLQKDLIDFSNTWFNTIKNQGYALERELILHEFQDEVHDVYVNYHNNEVISINCDERVQANFIEKNNINIKPIEPTETIIDIPPEDIKPAESIEEPTSIVEEPKPTENSQNVEHKENTLIEVSNEELNEVAYSLQRNGSFDFISPNNNEIKSIKYNENNDSYFMINNYDNSIINFDNNFTKVRNAIKDLLSQGYGYEGKEPLQIQVQEVSKDKPKNIPKTDEPPTIEVISDTSIAESVHKSKKKSTTKKSSSRKAKGNKKLTASELYEKFYKVEDIKPIDVIQDEVLIGDKVTYHSTLTESEHTTIVDRYNNNINAIKTLRQVEEEHRYATPQEQEIMSKYAGWGGVAQAFDTLQNDTAWKNRSIELKSLLTDEEYKSAIQSTNTSFYTSPEIINSMYKALKNFGFEGGNMLEPSMATGNFFSNMPNNIMNNSKLYGVEIDDISGRIAKQLYPDANIKITGFENTTYSNNSFDIAIGNVPFGNFSVSDQEYNKNNFLIHDYFFAKAIDKVKPTGVIAFVTSSGTMDKENDSVRKYIAERCDLIGAIRLPNNAFDNAGTSVTSDIIFLQKRDTLTTIEPDWVKTSSFEGNISINNYFEENPDMVLGELKVVSGRFGNQLTVAPNKDTPLSEQLDKAIQNLHLPTPMKQSIEVDTQNQTNGKVIPANPDVKNFTYTQIGDDIYYRSNEIMVQQNLKGKTLEKVIGLNSIRNAMNNLLEAQERNCSDEELKALQDNLNTIYDNYTNRLGTSINSRGSKSAFKNDVEYNTICALESYSGKDNNDNPIYEKSDIFSKRTIRPTLDVSITSVHDTLQISLNNKGCVDIEYMTELAQKHINESYTADKIVDELSEHIFINPIKHNETDIYSGYETKEEYLSGNIREKIKIAESFNKNGDYDKNISALEDVLPPIIPAEEITAQIGATWIDTSDYELFMKEVLNTINHHEVSRTPSGSYHISNKTMENTLASTSVWGVEQLQSVEIFEKLLNHSTIQIKEVDKNQPKDEKGNYRYVVNKEATQNANDKAEKMKNEFSNWLWQTPERREKYQQRYNELFNSIKGRTYDGSYLTFPNMSTDITLKSHQKNAIARAISNGNTLLAHAVGAGKSFEMIATVMEKKRLGLLSKACVTVPNSLVMQMYNEWKRLYPTANILVATDIKTKADREKFVAQSATGNFDAVIISHDSFRSIPMSNEFTVEYINKQIDTLEQSLNERKANGDRISIKDIQSSIKRLKKKLEDIATNKKDDSLAFDKIGFDALVVDEAHVFKNAMINTKMTNVKGVASKSGSAMANDMAMKCEYLNKLTNYQNVVFATGTPVSNSMTEFYTMQNYLRPDILEKCGIKTFDDWASVFGNTVTQLEPKPAGDGYRMASRFCEFCNVPEMMNQYLQFADVINREQLDIPNLPTIETGNMQVIKATPSKEQLAIVKELADRSEAIHNGAVNPKDDNHLKITNEARLLGLDACCLDKNIPINPNGKISKCIDKVEEIYNQSKDNVQAIFCDIAINSVDGEGNPRFSAYDHIKNELIKRGIPADEICLANDAQNPTDKAIMLNQLQNAQKRIVIASTSKMGTGANFQNHLKAIHNLDIPWRPSDYEQRLGRILRQGNQNKEIGVYQYLTERTFDAYMLNVVATKQKFIGQISNIENGVSKVGRTASDVDELTLTYQEMQSIASGDPRIKEKIQLDIEVAKLRNEQSNHNKTVIQYKRLADEIPQKIINVENNLQKATIDLSTYQTNYETMQNAPHYEDKKPFQITLNGTEYTDRKSAGEALEPLINKAIYSGNPTQTIGNYCGFSLKIEKSNNYLTENPSYDIVLTAKLQYRLSVELNSNHVSGTGAITRLENFAKSEFNITVNQLTTSIEKLQSDLANAIDGSTKPFEKVDLLKQKEERLSELNAYLSRPVNEIISDDIEEVAEIQETQSKYEEVKPIKEEPSIEQKNSKAYNEMSEFFKKDTKFLIENTPFLVKSTDTNSITIQNMNITSNIKTFNWDNFKVLTQQNKVTIDNSIKDKSIEKKKKILKR